MVCTYCGSPTNVINSRPQKKANQVWRRRQCMRCGNIFTTTEIADLSTSILVSHNGSLQPFQRDKLLLSVHDCLRHRKDPIPAATALTATIISKLLGSVDDATLLRSQVIATTSSVLKNFDHAAYIQYTAFHPAKG